MLGLKVACQSVFALVYGCWPECRPAARVFLTRSHISAAELASDNESKGCKRLRIKIVLDRAVG